MQYFNQLESVAERFNNTAGILAARGAVVLAAATLAEALGVENAAHDVMQVFGVFTVAAGTVMSEASNLDLSEISPQ